jgi:hypothetical protein
MPRYRLSARVSSANAEAVRPTLREFIGPKGVIEKDGVDLTVHAELDGASARDLNRALLSALRRVEKRTRLRSEWTAEGVCERFFDYVPKGQRPV